MTEARLYAIWAAVGPLVGVIVGGLLTAWWQSRQWVLDNRAREYREVLDALNTYRQRLLSYHAKYAGVSLRPASEMKEDQMALGQSQLHLDNVLVDRIFTREAVAKSGVADDLMKFYQSQISASPPSITQATEAIADIHSKLLETAVTDLKLKRGSRKRGAMRVVANCDLKPRPKIT